MEIVNFFKAHWDEIAVAYLVFHKCLVAVRDAYDKTPDTDDNWFEKFVTITGKLTTYLITGRRASKP